MSPYGLGKPATWAEQAACIGADDEIFFAEHSKSRAAQGKAICRTCPVRQRCLDEAVRAEEGRYGRFGIFGGLTPTERAKYAGLQR